MINKKDVSIIIPHYLVENTTWALLECLTSLEESGFPVENIIIAHNGDTTELGLAHLFPDIQEVFMLKQGQCGAVNEAVERTSTDWIMVSNNDMIYPEDWFERLVDVTGAWIANGEIISGQYLASKPNGVIPVAGDVASVSRLLSEPFVLSPQLIEPTDGAHTFKKVFFGGVGGDWNKQGFMEYSKVHESVGIRTGFNLPFLMKRETWDLVEGYDINYDPWSSNSDSDLQYKLKLAGIPCYQNTSCPVYHFSQTSGTFHPSRRDYWQKNWDYFIEKWGFPRTDDGIWDNTFTIPYKQLKYRPKWAVLPEVEAVYGSKSA